MSSLGNYKQERFAQLYAIHGGKWTNEAICKEAGYGTKDSSTYYFNNCVNRLLGKPEIAERIREIQKGTVIEVTEKTVQNALENYLVSTVFMDYTHPFKLVKGKTKQGREVQGQLMKFNNYEDMSEEYRIRVEGFDANGNPKFISKMRAVEMWIKMKGIDKTSMDISELRSFMEQAGLRVANFEDGEFFDEDSEQKPVVQTDYSNKIEQESDALHAGVIRSLAKSASTSQIHVAQGCDGDGCQ